MLQTIKDAAGQSNQKAIDYALSDQIETLEDLAGHRPKDPKAAVTLSFQIQDVLPRIRDAYYKLILAVGPAGTGKTAALNGLAARHNWPRINVNLRLSEKLLDLTHRQRAVRVAGILDDIVREQASDVVLLDNIELLFAKELALNPLRLLQSLSRNRTIVAAWPGNFDGGSLTYAEAGHPELRRYPTPQAVIVKTAEPDQSEAGAPGKENK